MCALEAFLLTIQPKHKLVVLLMQEYVDIICRVRRVQIDRVLRRGLERVLMTLLYHQLFG